MIRDRLSGAVLASLVLLGTPFAMLSWLAPGVGPRTLGNDYLRFSIQDQLDLMWSVWHGTFPLYLPGFASGHSAAAATMGQLYHPISWLATALPGYWHGYALECNTLLRLLSLGLAQLVLYRLLRRLHVAPLPSLLSTLAAVYNLRMLDSFRFGAPLEGYVGMLLLAAAAGRLFLDEQGRLSVALVGASSYLLLVSGHPQWAYQGSLGACVFALLFPWIARALDPGIAPLDLPRIRRYLGRLTLGCVGGVLLAAPYLLTFYFECYLTNADRVAQGYEWTLLFSDSASGELANILLPLRADVHGAFGGSALFTLAAFFPVAAILERRTPKVLWVLYGWALLAFVFALGSHTFVHRALVETVPLLGSFRVPGRAVLWIPLACLPLLAWMLTASSRAGLLGASAAALLFQVLGGLWAGPTLQAGRYSPVEILKPLPPYLEGLLLQLSAATLAVLVLAAAWPRRASHALALAGLGVAATTWLCLHYGTWQAERPITRTLEQISAERRSFARLDLDAGVGMEMRRVASYRRHGLSPRRPLATVEHAAERADSEPAILARLSTEPHAPLLVEASVPPRTAEIASGPDQVQLTYNTHNRHVFDVVAAMDGYVVLGLPWLDGFEGRVDGRRVTLVRANALYPAVFVPPGRHVVDFRFVSRPFVAGLGFAIAGAILWVLWWPRCRRLWVVALAISLVAAFVLKTKGALFDGPSFGKDFHWQAVLEPAGSRRPAPRLRRGGTRPGIRAAARSLGRAPWRAAALRAPRPCRRARGRGSSPACARAATGGPACGP